MHFIIRIQWNLLVACIQDRISFFFLFTIFFSYNLHHRIDFTFTQPIMVNSTFRCCIHIQVLLIILSLNVTEWNINLVTQNGGIGNFFFGHQYRSKCEEEEEEDEREKSVTKNLIFLETILSLCTLSHDILAWVS